ncbi:MULTISPECIES: protein-disulfide reductase DsbD family protein [Flavobacterium]|uniref:protein-disulfide reductase DsbD family protein n=1 Tax=Flavobacterium TaxID=237 RepID=UPI0021141FA6|nr:MULTISPECIES: thioredoxin family protein [Flavobacterium]UUF14657.1 thioredoxin family protein [Flavobacterium panici]
MDQKFKGILGILFVLFFINVNAQIQENPVKWKSSIEQGSGDTLHLKFSAVIKKGWHINSQFNKIKDGPLPTSFHFEESDQYVLAGRVMEPKPLNRIEKEFENQTLYYFENEVTFIQKIIPKAKDSIKIKATVNYMSCGSTMCLPPETEEINLKYLPKKSAVNAHYTPPVKEANLWWIFLGGFLGGFLAILTPCVFSMIPLTVSYFTKNGGIKRAIIYAASIVAIYVTLGLTVTLTLGPDALNALASNGIVNFIFFLIFVVFAISFLGAFEITLPSSWLNKSDEMADKGGLIGIFFMAFTLALVSFSCTGPIIGNLLVEAAISGSIVGPAIGMFGFSFALSIPFLLFAAFPSMLKKLPKSGSWLGKVKVILGFLELALALKFLSTFDLVYGLGILKCELFIAIWIVIFTLFGFYMLGKLKFDEYENNSTVSISGFVSSILIFSFVVYLIPGLWGAPLKLASGFLPPSFYKEWNQNNSAFVSSNIENATEKHSQPCPQNLNCFHDYEEGLAYAKKVNKPIILDFTGWSCVNCRKMEDNVWSDKEVWEKLNNNYVLISLYVDDTTVLTEKEQFISKTTGKKIKTIGNKWSNFQTEKFQTNSQPYYALMDTNGNMLSKPAAYEPDIKKYAAFLQNGIENF